VFTLDAVRCGAVRHRATCCIVFAAYRKTPHRNATQQTATQRASSGVNDLKSDFPVIAAFECRTAAYDYVRLY